MRCPSCSSTIPDGGRFCSACGFDLQARADERRVVTVLFGDLVGFTAFSETADPERVKLLVDRCFERLVRDIVEFGGRVDKIVGDAIVALFGAPVAHEDDAERAVRAALQMQETMRTYAGESEVPIRMRIGINTGEVLTGAMRAGGDYTAMGDVVNTANRLQVVASSGEVVVGQVTYHATREAVSYEPLGFVEARGRDELVEAWRATEVFALPGRQPRRRRSPLVGRKPEMTLLRQTVDVGFRTSRTTLILLLGEAGVGKTRLADELAEAAQRDHGARMIESRCVPYGEANIWYPIGSALQDLCNVTDDAALEEAQAKTCSAVADALGQTVETPAVQLVANSLLYLMGYDAPLQHLEPQRAREEAGRSVVRFFEALASKRPLLFRLADLHWADDLVLALLEELLNRLRRSPFVLVAGARHLLDPRWAPRLGRHNHVIVNLDPLDSAASTELLDNLVGGKDVSLSLRETLLVRSGGNPFFLEELVALTDLSETVPALDLAWGTSSPSDKELPETLRGLVAARLDRVSDDERKVLEDAAVVGRYGPLYALERMAERSGQQDRWRASLQRLVDGELLDCAGTRWSFRSDLVREVAYSTLTKADRAQRHADIASWMEENLLSARTDDGVVDRIAFHYGVSAFLARELEGLLDLPADLTERALRWLGEAARRAQSAEVNVLAGRLFSQALDLAGEESSSERLGFLLGRAEARLGQFELAAAAADVEEALTVAAALGDQLGVANALLAQAEVEQRLGQLDVAESTTEEALAMFGELGDRRGEAETLRLLGRVRLYRRNYPEAERNMTEALAIFRELGDRRREGWSMQNLAWVALLSGRVGEAETRLDESVATFAEIGDTGGLAWSKALLGFTRFRQGRLAEAEQLGEDVLPDTHQRGDRFGEGMALLLTAQVRLWTGRTQLAVERADEARALFARIGDPLGQVQAEGAYGRALAASGRVVEGLTALEDATQLARRSQAQAGVSLAALGQLSAALHIGDVRLAAAIQPATVAARPADDELGGGDWVVAEAMAQLQRGEFAAAVQSLAERIQRLGPDASPNALVALALAKVAQGDSLEGLHLADRAHESQRATYLDLALAHVASGLAHGQRGDSAELIAAFAAARQEVDLTGDAVAQAVVRLAESHALTAIHATSARAVRREAERRLAYLEIGADGWSTLFRGVQRQPGEDVVAAQTA